MARLEKIELCARNISFKEFSTLHREDSIVFAPSDQRGGLLFTEVLMPIGENIKNSSFMASTWAPPFCMIIAVTRSGCMTANRKPTDAPMSERYSAYEERFSFSVNFSVTVANRSKE